MKSEFKEIANMESIVGAVNGIHIQIKRPVHYEEVFLNQREYHSLFVQVSSKWFMVSDVFFFSKQLSHV